MKLLLLNLLCFISFYQVFSQPCDNVPDLNKDMLAYVKTTLHKKVGKGECWDLAAQGLNKIGADWNKEYVFGKEVDPKKECIYPGDIIQFENVEVEFEQKGVFYKEQRKHHTAVVYEVKGKDSYIVAEQNTTNYGRKVGLNPLELKNIRKGTIKIYQPVK